jgi:hypothetical protein
LRWVVAAAVGGALSVAAISASASYFTQINFWMSGTAYVSRDYYANTVANGYHLENRETSVVSFAASCAYVLETARVRPGEPLLCDASKSVDVFGRVEDESPLQSARDCTGTVGFRPGAQFFLGGTLDKPNVLQATTGAPFASYQIVVTNSNPLADSCNGLLLYADGPSKTYTVNGPTDFPVGTAENHWKANLGPPDVPVHTMFAAELTVNASDRPYAPADAIRGPLEQWWNATLNFGRSPGGVTIDIPWVGTVHATFTPASGVGHGPLRRNAHTAAATALFTVDASVHAGVNVLHPQLTALGRAVLSGAASAPEVQGTVTLKPQSGSSVTATGTFRPLVPPAIASVQFSGTPANPTIIIRGRDLTPLPAQSPNGTPVGHNGCPAQSGDYGVDYGSQLYVDDLSKGWAGGQNYGNNTSCIGLIATKVTWNELDLRLGSFYTGLYPKFTLAAGDQVQVVANGAPIDVHLRYGAPVTS